MEYFKLIAIKRHSTQLGYIFVCTLVLVLNACGTIEKVSPNEIQKRYANLNAVQALEITEDRFTKAISEQYDYFSPLNWEKAGQALRSARTLAKLAPHDREIFKHTFLVERRIDSAQYIKGRVLKTFSEHFNIKKILEQNKAQKSFEKDYSGRVASLASLIKDYESLTLGKKFENVTQRGVEVAANKLLKDMSLLNIKVVKHNYLSAGIARIREIEKREAKTIAPVSYKQVEAALENANAYIEQNVHDQPGVQRVSEKFNFSVAHLDHVTSEIIALSKVELKQLESVILLQEHTLLKIGKALSGVDVRNLPLNSQAESVIKTANNVLNHDTEKSTMIVELSEKNLLLKQQLDQQLSKDVGSTGKLKSKIKLLEIDIQTLEQEKEKLKEDLFALQQKNIDLAIQNAKLLADKEQKQSDLKSGKVNSITRNTSKKRTVSQLN